MTIEQAIADAVRDAIAPLAAQVAALSAGAVTLRALTREQLAEQWGLSVQSIDKLTREAGLPHIRQGVAIRFPVSLLAGWLAEHSIRLGEIESPGAHGRDDDSAIGAAGALRTA